MDFKAKFLKHVISCPNDDVREQHKKYIKKSILKQRIKGGVTVTRSTKGVFLTFYRHFYRFTGELL